MRHLLLTWTAASLRDQFSPHADRDFASDEGNDAASNLFIAGLMLDAAKKFRRHPPCHLVAGLLSAAPIVRLRVRYRGHSSRARC
jgi:hypothetical protein